MSLKKKRKKWLLAVIALVLTAALGVGIWFGTKGSAEPVNVYSFQYIGMTEFWGDMQESYGPVTTDKIQTEFLSDTQTVTEVKVKDGDTVKKGDVLFTFDTTLDTLSLERKRLEVEKIKVQIKAAEERLQETREMVPYVPPEPEEPDPEELGEELTDKLYKISENVVYDGSKQETALICWLKDTTSISDAILQELYETSLKYREENAKNQAAAGTQPENTESSSASEVPENQPPSGENQTLPEEEKKTIPAVWHFNGTAHINDTVDIGREDYKIVDAYSYQGKTYWLKSAKCGGQVLEELVIPAYPQEAGEERDAWEARVWKLNISVR